MPALLHETLHGSSWIPEIGERLLVGIGGKRRGGRGGYEVLCVRGVVMRCDVYEGWRGDYEVPCVRGVEGWL